VRVARLYATGDIRVGDEPEPAGTPSVPRHEDDEALVRVTAVGICGSDLHWWTEGAIGDAKLSRPLVLGHEGAGVIAAGPRRGERVAIDPAIPCEACRACHDGYRNLCYNIRFAGHGETDGMLREQLRWPARLLHPLPDQVSDDAGALLEPLGVALHAMDLGHVPFGGRVTVVGCGPIGLLLCQLLQVAGAASVTAFEPLPHRRAAAAGLGVTVADPAVAADPAALAELTGGGVDVAFEIAGTDEAVQLAMAAARPGGRVVLGGIPDGDTTTFRASTARRKGLTIAMVRRMNEVYPRAISLVAAQRVDVTTLVTARYPLEKAAEAFSNAAARTGLKVIVEPGA
jgi:L-iditol 2-dehydrogenase